MAVDAKDLPEMRPIDVVIQHRGGPHDPPGHSSMVPIDRGGRLVAGWAVKLKQVVSWATHTRGRPTQRAHVASPWGATIAPGVTAALSKKR